VRIKGISAAGNRIGGRACLQFTTDAGMTEASIASRHAMHATGGVSAARA
jgi:hypothetical protein